MEGHESHGNAGFHDYTISSTFEKCVAGLEAILGNVQKDTIGRRSKTYALPHGFPFRREPYKLTYLPVYDSRMSLREGNILQNFAVKFHEWFTVEDCIVIEPDSYSKRILSLEEYHTILSAVSVAIDNLLDHGATGYPFPVYIPRHDALRDAYGGIKKVRSLSGNVAVQRFECDSIHGWVQGFDQYISNLKNRLLFFSERLQCHDTESAGICAEIAESLVGNDGCVCWTKKTYHMYHDDKTSSTVGYTVDEIWDANMPWAPWVNQDDPIGGVELDILCNDWEREHLSENDVNTFADDVAEGSHWRLFAMDTDHAPDTGERPFLTLQVADTSRKFFHAIDIEGLSENDIMCFPTRKGGNDSFCATLYGIVDWYHLVRETAKDVECLTADAWWMENAEIFEAAIDPDDIENLAKDIFIQEKKTGVIEERPGGIFQSSLFERFALNATIPNSLRGLAQLWMQFLHHVRAEHLEKKQKIPFMENQFFGPIIKCCSIVRTLESLNYCIQMMDSKVASKDFPDCVQEKTLSITLLDYPERNIKVPITQSVPLEVLEMGICNDSRGDLYKKMLLSDMQAFKAVNQGCRFEDFIRWYSPRDWIESSDGGSLSRRMTGDSEWTNSWKIAEPIPINDQNILLNPSDEAENILSQLESIEPCELISQMSLALFSAACQIMMQSTSKLIQRQLNLLIELAGQHAECFSCFDVRQSTIINKSSLRTETVTPGGFGIFNVLGCIEHNAAAAASLHQRLTGIDQDVRTRLVEGMLESAMKGLHGFELDKTDAKRLAACGIDTKSTLSFDGPVAIEHSVEIVTSSGEPRVHRLFVNRLSRETRIATSVSLA